MEENVALDSTNQKKFVKSIKGIKKLIKKNENKKSEEVVTPKPKDVKAKRKRPARGLVYLSHIPHGFYEHEMSQYFKQFGMVTNVRVIRSKRTGNSKGFAFVEFKEPAVAEIVAETMNNYLMGKRLIKAAYVPPEKQRPKAMRKHWSRLNNPGIDARLKNKKAYNENKDEAGNLKKARKILSNINKTKKKLSEMGINYDFFTPVDIPESIQNSLNDKENAETKEIKKDKKPIVSKDSKESKKSGKSIEKQESKIKLEKNQKTLKAEVPKPVNSEAKSQNVKAENKKKVQEPINKKDQKNKQQKLKEAGVSPPENFIKVQEDPEDSDSSMEFDSDEYEKMLEDDGSDIDSGDDSEANDEGDDSEEEDESDEEEEITPPPKKSKGKPAPVLAKPQPQKQAKKSQPPQQVKRKASQKPPQSPKKPKFEKQSQQPLKKQFKKKK